MKNSFLKFAMLAALMAWTGVARAIPLDVLFGGDSISVGGLLFDNWTLDDSLDGMGTTHGRINMSGIDVTGVVFGPNSAGLVFDAGDELALAATGNSDLLGLYFNFTASVLAGGEDLSSITIDADYELFPGADQPASAQDVFAEKEILTGAGVSLGIITEWSDNPALPNSLAVSGSSFLIKDFMQVEVSEGGAILNSWDQRFASASVPAPAPFALFALGLAGMAWVRSSTGRR